MAGVKKLLMIAGSESGGSAVLQSNLNLVAGHGRCAATAITARNMPGGHGPAPQFHEVRA